MKDYATLIATLAERDPAAAERATGTLIESLRARGELKLLPRILKGLRPRAARLRALSPRVETARAEDAPAALKAAAEAGITAEKATVNPSLIRGWRARAAGRLVDRSGKRALIDIYQSVTR